MKWSKAYIPTLKENPADAEVISHKLMIRASLIRKLSAGAYTYLPLGFKVLKKIQNIIREEMNARGAQEILMPAIQPKELWDKTKRAELLGEILITYKDRHGKINILGPTHEEIITDLAAKDIRSYKDLPQILYQIQTKFRDEPRPRFGVLRSKEFIMKDAYSFDSDTEGLNRNYKAMYDAYCKIFTRCGLNYVSVEADSGFMGGDVSHEFMCPAESGEDTVEGKNAIEVGHTFKLGTKYSEQLGAKFLDKSGKEKPCIMGCYGIGVNRIIAAVIEQNNDKDGIIWPAEIAPYKALIIEVNSEDKDIRTAGENLHNLLVENKIETLLDDRPERAGKKFKDADLIGIPTQIIIGPEKLKKKSVELKIRKTNKRLTVPIKDVKKRLTTVI